MAVECEGWWWGGGGGGGGGGGATGTAFKIALLKFHIQTAAEYQRYFPV